MAKKSVAQVFCSISDCVGIRRSKGYCEKHYQRLRKKGTLEIKWQFGNGVTMEERFWSRVALTADDTRCWLWLASTNQDGYGRIATQRKNIQAHRYAWFLTHGVMPNGLLLHSCDTPRCVNPKHLREGTNADNAQDRDQRHRTAIGNNNGKSKLSETQVRDMKQRWANGEKTKDIAHLYPEVGIHNLWAIKRGLVWRHVE